MDYNKIKEHQEYLKSMGIDNPTLKAVDYLLKEVERLEYDNGVYDEATALLERWLACANDVIAVQENCLKSLPEEDMRALGLWDRIQKALNFKGKKDYT